MKIICKILHLKIKVLKFVYTTFYKYVFPSGILFSIFPFRYWISCTNDYERKRIIVITRKLNTVQSLEHFNFNFHLIQQFFFSLHFERWTGEKRNGKNCLLLKLNLLMHKCSRAYADKKYDCVCGKCMNLQLLIVCWWCNLI